MNTLSNYPEAPRNVDPQIISPTPDFKKQVIKITGAIVFFLASYIVLLVLGMCLAVACSYLGIALIAGYPHFITLILGAGLIGVGLMVLYFLIKFVFKRNKVDRSGFIEITVAEQPELFKFIEQVSIETQSQLPKRVYISDDVNASVFYDSSFLSLFLPVKKNLRIGLGLVNVVNVSEFKAIIAHEFGHFSQHSMKFGSYVYYVNNIIYNMLYDNDNYDAILGRWVSIHSYFKLFAKITIYIVRGIQYLLKQIYTIINKAYSSLSIQMEFHADSVAAFVTGSSHLVTSLKKLEVAQICYDSVLNYCDAGLSENLQSDNFYPQQNIVIKRFAEKFKIPYSNGELNIAVDTPIAINRSRIVITDQWASHPSLEDRAAKLKQLNIETPVITDNAWSLFKYAEQLQQDMTLKKYDTVNFKQKPTALTLQLFTERFYERIAENNFNEEYKRYYDGREIARFVTTEAINDSDTYTFDQIFSDDNCAIPEKISALKQDMQLLDTIADEKNGIKSFDFDGTKYGYHDAYAMKKYLEAELKTLEDELNGWDKKAYCYFYKKASAKGNQDQLEQSYLDLFKNEDECKHDMIAYNELIETMRPVYGHMPFTQIRLTMQDVKLKENNLLPRLKDILEPGSGFVLTDQQKENLAKYLNHTHIYFMQPNYDSTAIAIFNTAMHTFAEVVMDRNFKIKKELLSTQLNYDIGQREDCY